MQTYVHTYKQTHVQNHTYTHNHAYISILIVPVDVLLRVDVVGLVLVGLVVVVPLAVTTSNVAPAATIEEYI